MHSIFRLQCININLLTAILVGKSYIEIISRTCIHELQVLLYIGAYICSGHWFHVVKGLLVHDVN